MPIASATSRIPFHHDIQLAMERCIDRCTHKYAGRPIHSISHNVCYIEHNAEIVVTVIILFQ